MNWIAFWITFIGIPLCAVAYVWLEPRFWRFAIWLSDPASERFRDLAGKVGCVLLLIAASLVVGNIAA